MTHHIVFLDRDTIAPTIEVRRPDFDHQWTEYDRTSAEDVAERVKDATIIINNKVALRAETLNRHSPDSLLVRGNHTTVPPSGERNHFRRHPMT
jgi:hypothetical protein